MKVLARLETPPGLTDAERQVLDSVRAVAREKMAPRTAAFDRDATFPWPNIEDINGLGLNAMFVPEAHGGTPLSYTTYLACVLEIAMACPATAIIWATNFRAMKPVIDFGTDDQMARFLPPIVAGALASLCITEPHAGSDATGMHTRFIPDGDDILVEGGKTFITSGDVADLYLIFGKWSAIDDPKAAISVLVMEKDTPGLSAPRTEDKMGVRASSTAQLVFESCRVPRANLIGAPGDGLRILFSALNKSRPSVAAQSLGIARAAFDDAVAYANQRQQSGRPVLDFQGIQFMVADLATEIALVQSWLWRVGGMIDGGEADVGLESSMLKMRASDLAVKAATDAVQIHGGYGYLKDSRVERLYRDAKITQIWEGTNQIHRQLIGRGFIDR